MTNHDPKLTIFISSMIGLLWDERAAVEKAITTGIPLARPWVFERAPASSEEITESYLARVRECDIYLLILGDNISDPVKAEYRTAVECDKPRLCFVQEDVKRTEALEEFLPTLQADVKYATFTDRESLQREVLRAVQQELVLAHKHYRLGEAERDQLAASIGLPPIWNLPHPRNPNFTGRETLLTRLHKALTSGQPAALTQAITGLGGIGKTQLATEYAYRHKADYTLVWWIRAEQPAALAADYAALAVPLNLDEKHDPDQRLVVQAVWHWLGQHTGWLLIFDNAPGPEDVRPYLPQEATGHVIVTSRHAAWRGTATPLTVQVLDRPESVAFLLKRTGQTDETAADALAEALGDLAGARAAYERALAIDEAVFGPEHPNVAIRVNNLGSVLKALGDLAGARAAYERALAIDEAVFGPDHPNVARDVNNLGSVLKALGDLAGARAAYERALAIREKVLGGEHPDTALSLNNLGALLRAMGDLAGARPYLERALAILRQSLGEDHPHTVTVQNNLDSLDV